MVCFERVYEKCGTQIVGIGSSFMMQKNRMEWFGHVECEDETWVKCCTSTV